ncbi:MAG: SCO family protein [Flavobacteriaceae bacterium]|nr:SCO family protein [Flavobacteriaceae bacterium]
MFDFFKKYYKFFGFFFLVCCVMLYFIYNAINTTPKLPVYQPVNMPSSLFDDEKIFVKKYHRIADFALVNQNGDTITQEVYQDKIYVADFFFTTCPTICPVMTDHMRILQQHFLEDQQVLLLSHSVTPEIDSVPVLKAYAIEKGVKDHKWNLVTGDRKQIYDLARKSYGAATLPAYDADPYEMIHTENFILVDPKGQIRGTYDGTNAEDIQQIIEDIAVLKKEFKA